MERGREREVKIVRGREKGRESEAESEAKGRERAG